jgi:hypothetical protein
VDAVDLGVSDDVAEVLLVVIDNRLSSSRILIFRPSISRDDEVLAIETPVLSGVVSALLWSKLTVSLQSERERQRDMREVDTGAIGTLRPVVVLEVASYKQSKFLDRTQLLQGVSLLQRSLRRRQRVHELTRY